MKQCIKIEQKIIEFVNYYKTYPIKISEGIKYNSFIQCLKDNARDIKLYECLNKSSIYKNKEVLKIICIEFECAIEKYYAKMYLENNKDLIERRLEKCKRLMKMEGNLLKLNKNDKVAILGSGAMPISAILFNKLFNAYITCIDIDQTAIEYSKKVIRSLGIQKYIKFTRGDVFMDNIKYSNYTKLVITGHIDNKNKLLNVLYERIKNSTIILMRRPIGVYKFIYDDIDLRENLKYNIVQYYSDDKRFPFESIILKKGNSDDRKRKI